jgi:hypothetical protein
MVIVAVPLLYVLTIPVVLRIYGRTHPGPYNPPPWLTAYVAPLDWVAGTPLEEPIRAYHNWMLHRLR